MAVAPPPDPTASPYAVIRCGIWKEGPLFNIVQYVPERRGFPYGTRYIELRCADIWKLALAVNQGCNYIQFRDDNFNMKCHGCGLTLSKALLRQAYFIEILDIPPDPTAGEQRLLYGLPR